MSSHLEFDTPLGMRTIWHENGIARGISAVLNFEVDTVPPSRMVWSIAGTDSLSAAGNHKDALIGSIEAHFGDTLENAILIPCMRALLGFNHEALQKQGAHASLVLPNELLPSVRFAQVFSTTPSLKEAFDIGFLGLLDRAVLSGLLWAFPQKSEGFESIKVVLNTKDIGVMITNMRAKLWVDTVLNTIPAPQTAVTLIWNPTHS